MSAQFAIFSLTPHWVHQPFVTSLSLPNIWHSPREIGNAINNLRSKGKGKRKQGNSKQKQGLLISGRVFLFRLFFVLP
jgi:hypothetical protein